MNWSTSAKLSKYATCRAINCHVVSRFRFCLSNLFRQDSMRQSRPPNCLSRKAFKKPPAAHEPLASLAKGQLPLISHGFGGRQRQQELHHHDNDQPTIDEAKNSMVLLLLPKRLICWINLTGSSSSAVK
jgi:hypothetical protein